MKANSNMIKFLKQYMKDNNLSQNAMARKIGMDESNFSKVLNGQRKINRLDHIQKVASKLDVNPVSLWDVGANVGSEGGERGE